MRVTCIIALVFATYALSVPIDQDNSFLRWEGAKLSGRHTGKIFFKNGNLEIKDGNLVGGRLVADMNSFTVTDLKGDQAKKFLNHMKSKDFFEVSTYPTAVLEIDNVEGSMVTGRLTIKNKTRPVKFEYEKKGKTYTGDLVFNRTKFNMVYGRGNFIKNKVDMAIKNKVKLEFVVVEK